MTLFHKSSVIALLALVSHNLQAQTTNYKTYSVFLYSFAKYIEWPDPSKTGDFVITVYGHSKIVPELEAMAASRKVGSRSIKVVQATTLRELTGAHIVFIPDIKSGSIDEVLQLFKGEPVLIVTERDALIKKGACVSFVVTEDNLLRFEMNEAVIKEQQLKIPASLSSLAVNRI